MTPTSDFRSPEGSAEATSNAERSSSPQEPVTAAGQRARNLAYSAVNEAITDLWNDPANAALIPTLVSLLDLVTTYADAVEAEARAAALADARPDAALREALIAWMPLADEIPDEKPYEMEFAEWDASVAALRLARERVEAALAAALVGASPDSAPAGLDVGLLAEAFFEWSGFDPASPYVRWKRLESHEAAATIAGHYERLRAALAAASPDSAPDPVAETPVGPVRIRSANCAADDHSDCLGVVEQDVPELGITDCLCQCHGWTVVETLAASPDSAPAGLDVELLRAVAHERYESGHDEGCRHRNQHRSTWDCWREASEIVEVAAVLRATPASTTGESATPREAGE